MILTCPHCDEKCECSEALEVGQQIQCPFCDQVFEYAAEASAQESQRQGVKFCASCGAQMTLESRFCPNCGREVNVEQPPQQEAQPTQEPTSQPTAAPEARSPFDKLPLGVKVAIGLSCVTALVSFCTPIGFAFLAGRMLGYVVVGLLLFSLAKFVAFKMNPGLKAKVTEKTLSKIKNACLVLFVVLGLLSALAGKNRRGPSAELNTLPSNGDQRGVLSVQEERELLDKAVREMSGVFTLSLGVFANSLVFAQECEQIYLYVVDPTKDEALGKEIQAMLYMCQQLRKTASGAAESVKLVRSKETAAQKDQCMLVAVAMVAAAEAVEEYCGFVSEFHASEMQLAKLGFGLGNGSDVEGKLKNFINHHKAMMKVFESLGKALEASTR